MPGEPVARPGGGCPVMVWEGPYKFRCAMGGGGNVCARHGRFREDTPAPPVTERFEPDPSADDGVRRVAVCPICGWWEKADHTIGDEQPCGTEDDLGSCPGVCVVREIRIVPTVGAEGKR